MSEAAEVKLFGKWSLEDVEINDIALEVRARCPVFGASAPRPLAIIIAVVRP